jgi:hypothetical protein
VLLGQLSAVRKKNEQGCEERESENPRTTGKNSRERKKDLKRKEGVNNDRLWSRSDERNQEKCYIKE